MQDCLICKESFEEFIRLPCSHTYCNVCFKVWYSKNKANCCYCTQSFNLKNYMKVKYSEMNFDELKNIIKYAGAECTEDAMDWASEYGHIEIDKFLHSIDVKCTVNAMDCASRNGHLEVVKFLDLIGAKYTKNAINWASENGHLEVIQYLHSI